jgi:multidrug efflux system outer membrane protein
MPVPEFWSESSAPSTDAEALQWRTAFPDPALQTLITTALEENRDLRQAVFALEKARAMLGIVRADRLPNIHADGRHSVQRMPGDFSPMGDPSINRQWQVGAGINAFELDLFGRVKSLEDRALEEYLAQEEVRRAVHIGLVARVAQTYLALAGDREALNLARKTMRSRQNTLDLIQAQVENGLATKLHLHQAEEAVAVAQSETARLEAQVTMDENALALLTGTPVYRLELPAHSLNEIIMKDAVPAGLSSELLTRRPDILEAEHRLWAAGAQIGAARAAFFPRITLTAAAGLASLELSDLFDSAQRTWTFLPSFSVPIFDAGRNRANLKAAEAEQKIRVAAYEQAIQTAFREVADALAKNKGYAGQVQAQTRRVASSAQSRILVEERNQVGLESLFAVHDAERTLFSARLDLLRVRLAQKMAVVELFAALGGGWEAGDAAQQ